MFVITGATGNIGNKIADNLLSEGKQVKAIARHADKLAGLKKKGAEIVVGDLSDATLLAKAFAGAEGVFTMIPPNLVTEDPKSYEDEMGEAITKAIAKSGVKYVVNQSSIGAHLPSGRGPVTGHYRQEQRLNALPDVNILHLRPASFMENHINNISIIKRLGINGSLKLGDVKIPQIATQDIANHAAIRLLKKDFKDKQIQDLLGQRDLSMQEATTIIGKAIGKPDLKYVQFSKEDALKGMIAAGFSRSVAESLVEMGTGFNEGIGGMPTRNAANTTLTSIEEFALVFASIYNR